MTQNVHPTSLNPTLLWDWKIVDEDTGQVIEVVREVNSLAMESRLAEAEKRYPNGNLTVLALAEKGEEVPLP